MKINEAMKETGLTKKAIYYYEDEGLITPQKEIGNNYRNYTKKDIQSLLTIQVLRKLDVPTSEIKLVLSGQESLIHVIRKQLNNFNREIERLNKTTVMLESIISQGSDLTSDELKLLTQRLDESSRGMSGYMLKELDRILPGNVGKMFAIFYGQFLDGPLDTEEKEIAWRDLVAFLDSKDEFEYPDDIKQIVDEMYGQYNDQKWSDLSQKAKDVTTHLLHKTTEIDESVKRDLKVKISEYEQTPQYKRFLKFQKFTADHLSPIFKEVDRYIFMLSERFKNFNNIISKVALPNA